MDSLREELLDHFKIFESELRGNILPFWVTNAVRPDHSGFYGEADLTGKPVAGARQSCVLNSRILWTFSAAANRYKDPQFESLADLALKIVLHKFGDPESGGYYMELEDNCSVANEIKHSYVQAFVLYSLCRYYEFHPAEPVLERIKKLFYLFEEKCKDPDHPGYREAFTRDWKLYSENRMADHDEPKSMNTHLHVLEAYAALYRCWDHGDVKTRLRELIELFMDKIIRPSGHMGIFFDHDFTEVLSSRSVCSFGHDIEASWLLYEACEALGDGKITGRMKELSLKMASAVERDGVEQDGGLFLESTRYGIHLRTNKHWWIQAENLVGFMNAFQLSGDRKHWDQVKRAWEFIDRHVIDKHSGEWFTKVNRRGIPYLEEPADDPSPYYRNDRKIDPWKCPYHNSRAMMELMDRIKKMT